MESWKYEPARDIDLTPVERAKSLLNLGYTNRSIQAKLGLNPSQVSRLKSELDGEQRLATLGLNMAPHTQRNVIQAFGGPSARVLNDAPFRSLVKLTQDAGLTSREINAHAQAAKAAGSDTAALDYLDTVRSDLSEAIASMATAGVPTRPTPVGKVRDACRRVASLCDATINPSIYRDHTNGVVETVQLLDDALACLQAIRGVQVMPVESVEEPYPPDGDEEDPED